MENCSHRPLKGVYKLYIFDGSSEPTAFINGNKNTFKGPGKLAHLSYHIITVCFLAGRLWRMGEYAEFDMFIINPKVSFIDLKER